MHFIMESFQKLTDNPQRKHHNLTHMHSQSSLKHDQGKCLASLIFGLGEQED